MKYIIFEVEKVSVVCPKCESEFLFYLKDIVKRKVFSFKCKTCKAKIVVPK